MTVVPLLIKDPLYGNHAKQVSPDTRPRGFRHRLASSRPLWFVDLSYPLSNRPYFIICRDKIKEGEAVPPFCALLLLQFHYGDAVATLIKVSHPRGNDQAMFL